MNKLAMMSVTTVVVFLLATATANAHTGMANASGLLAGLSHPYSGLDHVLAMLAVGCFAARQGGRAIWFIPSLFIGAMLIGGLAGAAGLAISFVEFAIASSLVIIGLILIFGKTVPATAVIAVVAGSAIFHGYAHGAEMPTDASRYIYSIGFIIATSTLLCIGVGVERAIDQLKAVWSCRLATLGGGLMVLAGVATIVGMT